MTDADRLTLYETALQTIIKSMNEYLPPTGGDKDKFISEVIGAVDNPEVFRALNGTSAPSNAMVDKGMEEGK